MATPSCRSLRLSSRPHGRWNVRPGKPGHADRHALAAARCDLPGAGPRCRGATPAWRRHLVIMLKQPAAGRVKTRLAREVGVVAATAFYRHASAAIVARLGGDPRWVTHLAITPDTATRTNHWPIRLQRRPQGAGDLGRRMQSLFDRMPPGPVLIVGSDIPAVRPADVAAAFAALGRADAVLGPATDGGYWLVGERRMPRPLPAFSGVRWSCETTLADTVANFSGRRVALVREVADVDTAADLQASSTLGTRRIHPPS